MKHSSLQRLRFPAMLCALFMAALLVGIPAPAAHADTSVSLTTDLSFYKAPADSATLPLQAGRRKPRNIILMIGDGMGAGQLDLARVRTMGSEGKLNIQRMPVAGFVSTNSSNSLVTDSAAAATALATGFKANNGAISVGGDSRPFKTILEAAKEKGMPTGVVVTKPVTDATPACFYAHVSSRGSEAEIAAQMIESGPDIVLGGGKGFFLPKREHGYRPDDRDLLAELRGKGYKIAETRGALEIAAQGKSPKIVGLFADGKMETRDPEPSLAQMTLAAIKSLSGGSKGFFLMVEGSQIDTYSHANISSECLRQTLLFDQAVAEALAFAARDKDTLVLVTADHITGGLNIMDGKLDGKDVQLKWDWIGHTGGQVPLYAYGPGSLRFAGYHQNTELPGIMAGLLKIQDFPKMLPPRAAAADGARK